MEHAQEVESTSNAAQIMLVMIGILVLLSGAAAIALYTESFLLMMIGVPLCLVSAIGLGFWCFIPDNES
jgi:glucose dehydrogenase